MSRRLGVLHVIESLGRAGAEQALVNVLPRLSAAGHMVEVAALWPPYSLAEDLERRGVRVHRLGLAHRWSVPQALSRLVTLLRKQRYDVMHAHSFFSALYMALTHPIRPDIRRFVTFHNLGYESYPARSAWHRLRKRLDATLMRRAVDVHLAVSTATARHYEHHLGLARIEVQYNGIPLDDLAPAPLTDADRQRILARWKVPADAQVLLFCGRLVHEKGHRFFLAALDDLRARGVRPHALIVGDGPLHDAVVQEVSRRNLTSQVTMFPAVPHAELVELLRITEVLVMASTHEGFPLAPAEAMALERPVVATSVGGLPELIESGVSGILVPPADPTRLADALAQVLGDGELRRRLGADGRRRIAQRFSSASVAAELIERYHRATSTSLMSPCADGVMRAIDS